MPQEQYTLRCAVTSEAQHDILHIQVNCKIYQPQCYYKHVTFAQLPPILQTVFNNISHLLVHINRPEMVYFDNLESSIKICILIAGQIRQVPIKMQSRNRIDGIRYRIGLMQQQKAKNLDQFNRAKEEKEAQLELIKKAISLQNAERDQLQKQLEHTAANTMSVESQICQLNLDIEYKISQLKKLNQVYQQYESSCKGINLTTSLIKNQKHQQSHRDQVHSQTLGQLLKISNVDQKLSLCDESKSITQTGLQEKKQFWIKEIARIKNGKARALKQLIHSQTKFQEQSMVAIRGIELKKMLFVQVFINLQTIDLSNNHIRKIEGLTELKKLQKLDLSLNMIEAIKGLANNTLLDELILHSNRIKVLQNVYHLTNLRILSLSQNQLTVIPDKIGRMFRLVELKVGNNSISEISDRVLKLSNLKVFTVVGNRCYSNKNKSKQIIDMLIDRGVKTTE